MTDSDRLRRAADRLDEMRLERADRRIMEDGYPSIIYSSADDLTDATAALLRAVAKYSDRAYPFVEDGRIQMGPHPMWSAALALADAILGGTDD